MDAPIELVVSDALSLVFLAAGSIFLLKFLLKIGSPNSKKYSAMAGAALIVYALFHEGFEVFHNVLRLDAASYAEALITSAIAVVYLVMALMLRHEIHSIISKGAKKHGA